MKPPTATGQVSVIWNSLRQPPLLSLLYLGSQLLPSNLLLDVKIVFPYSGRKALKHFCIYYRQDQFFKSRIKKLYLFDRWVYFLVMKSRRRPRDGHTSENATLNRVLETECITLRRFHSKNRHVLCTSDLSSLAY